MESVILKVVLVLGIIIAGGFLLFFMADILMAIFNGKKDETVIKANETEEVKKAQETLADAGVSEEEAAALINGGAVESYNPEEDEAQAVEGEDEESEEEVEETEETEEAEEEEQSDEDREAYIEARRKALMERLAKMGDEDEEESEEEVEEAEQAEETEEETEEEAEETEEVVDLDEDAQQADDAEDLEEARRALEEERAKTEALQAELAQAKKEEAAKKGQVVYLTEEEYEARLAVLNERLKLNEKELRQCKREYIPLRKVKKSLESDEKKLRRKEALVAKQKVVLYGVNNYEDIDEEKAKKLAEDLDHLDGLKLSVEHCKEVMEKNADRYPLLERIYNVLSEQNETIKADIATAEKELAEVRAKKNK